MKEAGTAITLRAAIEFHIVRKRSDRDDWRHTQQMLSRAGETSGNEQLKKLAEAVPQRTEAWLNTCAAWDAFTAGAWSSQMLEHWMEDAMRLAPRG
jgi:hypothetical protein